MRIKGYAIEPGAKLRYATLRYANLHGADLRDADLRYATLRYANLHGADLHDTTLYGADLRGANLLGANLRGADLRGAKLRDATLRYANLHGANLRGADLRGADLRGADLHCATLPAGHNWWQGGRIGPRHRMIYAWSHPEHNGHSLTIYCGCRTFHSLEDAQTITIENARHWTSETHDRRWSFDQARQQRDLLRIAVRTVQT